MRLDVAFSVGHLLYKHKRVSTPLKCLWIDIVCNPNLMWLFQNCYLQFQNFQIKILNLINRICAVQVVNIYFIDNRIFALCVLIKIVLCSRISQIWTTVLKNNCIVVNKFFSNIKTSHLGQLFLIWQLTAKS